MGLFCCQINAWRVAFSATGQTGQQRRLAQMADGFAQHQRHMPVAHITADDLVRVVDQPHRANGGRGQDARAVGFVVQRHVARHDWHIQRRNRLADAFDRADQLAHDLWLFRIAKVEVVGRGQRARADCT